MEKSISQHLFIINRNLLNEISSLRDELKHKDEQLSIMEKKFQDHKPSFQFVNPCLLFNIKPRRVAFYGEPWKTICLTEQIKKVAAHSAQSALISLQLAGTRVKKSKSNVTLKLNIRPTGSRVVYNFAETFVLPRHPEIVHVTNRSYVFPLGLDHSFDFESTITTDDNEPLDEIARLDVSCILMSLS